MNAQFGTITQQNTINQKTTSSEVSKYSIVVILLFGAIAIPSVITTALCINIYPNIALATGVTAVVSLLTAGITSCNAVKPSN